MCGLFQQGGAVETDQTGLFQSTHRPTDLRAGLQLAADLDDGYAGSTGFGPPVLVDDPWGKRQQKAGGRGSHHQKVARLWGRSVIHIWDRGFAGAPWTTLALDHGLRFIVRWNNKYHVIGADGRKQEA